jgi:plastocyanin
MAVRHSKGIPLSAQPRLRIALCAVALVTGFAAAGCSSSSKPSTAPSSSTPGSTAASQTADTITIKNFMFGDPITVKAGATVTVMNTDSTTHTVAADDKSFNTGDVPAGGSKTFVAPKAGTYKFHCNIHNYMMGTLIVD